MNTVLVVMANTNESLDRTMASLGGKVPSLHFHTSLLVLSPGFDGEMNWDMCKGLGFADLSTDAEYPEGLNRGRSIAIVSESALMILRSGVEFDKTDVIKTTTNDSVRMEMTTIIDPTNGNIELTHHGGCALPIPQFHKGEKAEGLTEEWWVDGPIVYIHHKVLSDVGMFDNAMGENYVFIDYSIRARWLQHELFLNHDCTCTFMNKKPYNIVFTNRVKEQFTICRHNLIRKYGGDVIRTLKA